jgi:hypothetical protein
MKADEKKAYLGDIPTMYSKDIEAVAEMLKHNSEESLEKIYNTSKERIETGKFEVSQKIVFEAVKKLLKK